MYMQFPERPQEGSRFPETRFIDGCEPLLGSSFELGSPGRAASVLNYRAIALALLHLLFKKDAQNKQLNLKSLL